MKKIGYILTISVAITVVVVFVCTILYPNFNKKDYKTGGIFATNISIYNSARSIDLYIANSLHFTKIPYTITPKEYDQGVEVSVVNNLGVKQDNCKFENNCFSASEEGSYYLTFKIKDVYGGTMSDRIKINVKKDINNVADAIEVNAPSLKYYIDDNINLEDIVEIKTTNSQAVEYSVNNVYLNTKSYIPKTQGDLNFKVSIKNEGFSIIDDFNLTINEKVVLNRIELIDKSNNPVQHLQTIETSLSNQTECIYYNIPNFSNKKITVNNFDSEIIDILSKETPFIILRLKKIGKTKLDVFTLNGEYSISIFINVTE